MMYDFNAGDVFEMAAQMERNGAAFYRNAAGTVSEPESKRLLQSLADMEVTHENTFIAMKAGLSEKELAPTAFDPDSDAIHYLRSFADTRVFFEKKLPDLSVAGSRTERDVLRDILVSAIEAEKDSIIFYLGVKEWVPEVLGKGRIEGIIKEEMGHIRTLGKELAALKK